MERPIRNDQARIDYNLYPFSHAEDSERKIHEIKSVVPRDFRVSSILDVGCNIGIITQAVGTEYHATEVDGLEVSTNAITQAEKQLEVFPKPSVVPEEFETFETEKVYDLIMFIDVLEHMQDPLNVLKKASKIGRYAVIRCPLEQTYMNEANARFAGKDFMALMEKRYGHIHHFNMVTLSKLICEGGFDVIQGRNYRVPSEADVLANPVQHYLEQATWRTTRGFYPDVWGGFYVAFCKSRNDRIIEVESEETILDLLREEFGKDNLVALGLFGSFTQNSAKKYSDYDFIVILKEASNDQYEREDASPRLKRRLRENGLQELCSFNIYTQSEFNAADQANSWIIETAKNGYRVILDPDGFLLEKLNSKKGTVQQVDKFAWRGIKTESIDRIRQVAERHKKAADLAENVSPQMARFHNMEAQRGEMIATLYGRGLYSSRDSILGLAQKLVRSYGEKINLDKIVKDNFMHETENIPAIYRFDQISTHLEIAKILQENNLPLEALFHTYSALRNAYIHHLHNNEIFAIDGEMTQLFTREFQDKIPEEVLDLIYQNSFKAEQILGRSGYASFDIGSDGKPIYEEQLTNIKYNELLENLNEIITFLKDNKIIFEDIDETKPKVSIVIASYNRRDLLIKCLKSLNNLTIPHRMVEIVVVDDGSDEIYDVEELKKSTSFSLKYIKKDHTGICDTKNKGLQESQGDYVAFLDDDMEISPLWLARLLSSFKDRRFAGVGSTNLSYPDSGYLSKYSDYRELLRKPFRDKTGEVLNVLTCSAVFRRDALIQAGGFNIKQSEEGITFGGDDVDLTYKLRKLGYLLGHSENSFAFHNHRSNLKSFIKQHIGYGEGTMFHCIEAEREPSDLGIPKPTYTSIITDLTKYMITEIPKRVKKCYADNLGLEKSITYPTLDFARRFFYDVGILKAKKYRNKKYKKSV